MLDRGLVHTAPTYNSRDSGSCVPTAVVAFNFFVIEAVLSLDKQQVRKAASAKRTQIHKSLQTSAEKKLAAIGLDFLGPAQGRVVSGFYPYLSEISVLALFEDLFQKGWITSLPVVVKKDSPLEFRQWKVGDETKAGPWGILEPLDTAPVVIPDVLLVPLLAFDKSGYRLGYGGGFYDRTIVKLKAQKPVIVVGVCYSAQEVEKVPTQPHDEKLDWVLTENGPIKFGS